MYALKYYLGTSWVNRKYYCKLHAKKTNYKILEIMMFQFLKVIATIKISKQLIIVEPGRIRIRQE